MIVGILGPGGCGGTFIDWSLLYLSGAGHYLQVPYDPVDRSIVYAPKLLGISQDPLSASTAHVHKKTHPNDESLPIVLDHFRRHPGLLHSFYYVDSMRPDQHATHHNEIVAAHPDVRFITFNFQPHHVHQLFVLQYEKVSNVAQRFSEQIGMSLGHLSTGAMREILSLYYPRCIQGQILNEELSQSQHLYMIDFDSVWCGLDRVLPELFDWLPIACDQSRADAWKIVYRRYQERNQTRFFDCLPEIIANIISGRYQDLGPYNMTFAKEVVIASRLLYDHNLALKFEGIDDLSDNTTQWHDILEPNVYHVLIGDDK